MKTQPLLIAVLCILSLSLGVATYYTFFTQPPVQTSGIEGLYYPQTKPIKAFELVDYDAQPFTLANLEGQWSLLFFGYTHCPDICPMTLNVLKGVKQALNAHPAAAAATQYVFVSVDGQRDTPELLKGYVTYFDPSFIGATGERDAVNALTRQLGVVYFEVPGATPENYLVDHSSAILLVNPNAELVGIFSAPHTVEDIATRYVAMRDFIAQYEG